MSLAILFHLLCAQHVSDSNISIFRSLRLCWWITTSVALFSVRSVLQPAKRTPPNTSRNKSSNTQRTENKTTDVVIHQHSRKLLKMDILTSETFRARNKLNKIASDIKLVFHSSVTVYYLCFKWNIITFHSFLSSNQPWAKLFRGAFRRNGSVSQSKNSIISSSPADFENRDQAFHYVTFQIVLPELRNY